MPVDVRVVAATHRDLKAGVADGTFREDLYYRLAVFPVVLPPLRDRVGDVERLADYFLGTFSGRHGRRIERFTTKSKQALDTYAWPGNVRELENVVERAVILEEGDAISLGSLPDEVVSGLDPELATAHDGDGDSWFPPPTPLPTERRARTVDDIRKLDEKMARPRSRCNAPATRRRPSRGFRPGSTAGPPSATPSPPRSPPIGRRPTRHSTPS